MIRPRPYLSWTQLTTLEHSEKQYKKFYIEGGRLPINRGMALGKEVADALERDEETGDAIKDLVISQLPKFALMDHQFETEIKIGKIKIPLLSKIDTAKKDLSAFKEYKTGTTKWGQKEADKHGQITFYAVVIHSITGKIPQDIELVWAPTQKTPDGKVELTGEIKRFKTQRTMTDILKMKARMKNAWQRIAEIVEEELL